MAGGAGGVVAMHLHPLAQRRRLRLRLAVDQRRHVRRRIGRRRAEDVVQDPLAAQHRRGADGMRRQREDAAVPQQSPARATAPATPPGGSGFPARSEDAVVRRDPFVEERVVGRQEIQGRRVLPGRYCRRRAPSRGSSRGGAIRRTRGSTDRQGRTAVSARLRSCSHCPAKLLVSAAARGSASIRRTCRSSSTGSRRRPASADRSSASSGMLLQRKKESRDASSRSLMR